MILAAREPRATPRRSVHLTSHCPSTAPVSPSNRFLTHPAANRYPYPRPWDISAGLTEPGLEVRLRGLQSIRVKTVNNPDLDAFRPQKQAFRAQNPHQISYEAFSPVA